MDYFFDFELADVRGIPLYLPIWATAENLDDARFIRDQVSRALMAATYKIKQTSGPSILATSDQVANTDARRSTYETGRTQVDLPYSVLALEKSLRGISYPLRATVLDTQRNTDELLAITIEI